MQTSGLVLDLYDDTRGDLFRSIFPNEGDVPEQVKEAEALGQEERERLPDGLFALVLVGEGEKLRKYACYDAGNTLLSSAYFLKTAEKLPKEARAMAARNLVDAHAWYGLEPDGELKKMALGLNTAMTLLTAPSVIKGTGQAIKENMSAVRNLEGPGHIITPRQLQQAKMGEASGTAVMPMSGGPDSINVKAKAVIKKTAAHHLVEGHKPKHMIPGHGGEHDETLHNGDAVKGEQPERLPQARAVHFVTTKEQTEHPREKKAETYALPGRFPLDNLLQIKAASAYFGEYGRHFAPEDRRAFCLALVKKASALNLPLSDDVRKYGSSSYAPLIEIKVARDIRRGFCEPETLERKVLDGLFEKQAELSPELFCEALAELDKAAGFDFYYDRAVPDPYYSTFGMEKRAEEYSHTIGNETVTEEDLRRLGKMGGSALKTTFNADFLVEYQKDPIGIFKSVPRDQKLMIMRMANDTAPGEVRTY